MATISTASIETGLTVEAEHVTRIINALDGVASNNIIINADLKQGSTSNITNNSNSHAEGEGTTASGLYSHAEGKDTTASDDSAHAEGISTTAAGPYSHAEGEQTIANGRSSHAEGYYTIASANYQTAAGRYNTDLNTTDYFVIGNGSNGNRKDAFGVNTNGTYISSSFYLPGLGTSPEANILVFDVATGQVSYTASAAFQAPDPPVYFTINGNSFNAAGDELVFTGSNGLAVTINDTANSTTASYGFPTNAQVTLGGLTSSLFGTASWAVSASRAITSSWAISASVALSSSWAVSASRAITSSWAISSSRAITASYAENAGGGVPGGSNTQIQFNSASVFSGSGKFNFNYTINKVLLTGSMIISGSAPTSSLILVGSGSNYNTLGVFGTQGDLLTVTDISSGSLFSVNNISGLSVLDVYSDNTVLLGNPVYPVYNNSDYFISAGSGPIKLGSIPSGSYDGAYFEYIAKSGSNARSGYITATWSGSSIVSASITSSNIGDTSGLTTFIAFSSSYVVLSGSANAANWTIKSIIRAI